MNKPEIKKINKKDYNALIYSDKNAQDYILIDWSLWNICNYSCSYCPKNLHDGSFLWHDFRVILSTIDKISSHYASVWKKCIFQFTWWEVSLYPHLINILKYIKLKGWYTSIISNLSRKILWWEKSLPYLDNIIVTYHAEFVTSEDFIKKYVIFRKKQIYMYAWLWILSFLMIEKQ